MKTNNILYLFPDELRDLFLYVSEYESKLQEIRLRIENPVYVKIAGEEFFLDRQGKPIHTEALARKLNAEEVKRIINHICKYSIYAYEDELRQGFLTVPGGHRVGVVGQVVLNEKGEIRTIKHISAMNIRIAHQVRGAADKVLPYMYQGGKMKNTIIVSPPGCGKTTLLRDMIRQVSDGNAFGQGMNVGVVDERSEIAGCFHGSPQNDVGIRTDILDRCPKGKGMMLLIRSMAPEVVAIDELGEEEEWRMLQYASYCGISILATMHGEGWEDYRKRKNLCQHDNKDIFSLCIVMRRNLGKCEVTHIYEKNYKEEWECILQK